MKLIARLSVVAVLLFSACAFDRADRVRLAEYGPARVSETDVDPAPEVFALGTSVTPAGAVTENSVNDSFAHGGSLYLSVNVASASAPQDIEVEWRRDGQLLRKDKRHAQLSQDYVLFTTGSTAGWRRGPHEAVVMIDGRRVALKRFTLS